MGVFTRDESELLSYDADAFWYFAGTMLTAILLPWTAFLLRGLIWPKPAPDEDYDGRGPNIDPIDPNARVRRCTSAGMEAKRRVSIEITKSWRYRLSGGVWLQLMLVGALWLVLGVVCWNLKDSPAQLRSFDPHAILGLDAGADLREIKKAYRTKSLQHHPDKDRDNPLAHVRFQQVAKAYAALTDETARQNYAKYGNPDGPQQMKVGIALHPIVLVSKVNQRRTLCIFFFILFLVPSCILCCCLRGRLSFRGVSPETLRMLEACIDEEIRPDDGPGLLAASVEARRAMSSDLSSLAKAMFEHMPQPLERGDFVEVYNGHPKKEAVALEARGVVRRCLTSKVEVEVREVKPGASGGNGELQEFPREHVALVEPKFTCTFSDPPLRRNTALIWAHLWRLHSHMNPAAMAELHIVLRHSVEIGRAMISIAAHHPKHDQTVFFGIARSLVIFRRCLVQALDIDKAPVWQLPHVSDLKTQLLEDAPPFRDIVAGKCNDFLDRLKLSPEQRLDVEAFCHHAPLAELSCNVEVVDEENIAQGDVATLTVTLTRTNLEDGEFMGPVHAPLFPVPKLEEWWLLVYDERDRRLVTVTSINGTRRQEKGQIMFMVPRAGNFRWTVHAMCDSYAGLDVSCPVNFTALKRNEVSHEVFVHPEDMNIKTLFEELMEGLNPELEEEESESEDELPLRASVSQNASQPLQVSAAVAGAAEPTKPKHNEACNDSDSEDYEAAANQEPEGSFFEVTSISGAYIYREPIQEPELRIGSVPRGTVVRAYEGPDSSSPPGWAELAGAAGAWLSTTEQPEQEDAQTDNSEGNEQPSRKPADAQPCIKKLSGLMELPLRTIVQTRLPLLLLKRWMKGTSLPITFEDVGQIQEIEETMVRMTIAELVRTRIGDQQYEDFLDQNAEKQNNAQDRILKARGFFASSNGQSNILWHVSPSGTVRGHHPDGSKIRDKVSVSEEDEIRIGPFALDESRTCSCIHWVRKDDPERAWVWSRDRSLETRLRMGMF